MSDGTLRIEDRLTGSGRHSLQWHFHLAPGISAAVAGPNRVTLASELIDLDLHFDPLLDAEVVEGWYSPSYGIRVSAQMLRFSRTTEISGQIELVFSFAHRSPGQSMPVRPELEARALV
jgi:hypothetical protein